MTVFALAPARLRVSVRFFCHAVTATESYTLSLHDALPILAAGLAFMQRHTSDVDLFPLQRACETHGICCNSRSEEHTSELQSHSDLVCRLLLEKKNTRRRDGRISRRSRAIGRAEPARARRH